MGDYALIVIIGLLIGFNVAYCQVEFDAEGEESNTIVSAIKTLQPRYNEPNNKILPELVTAFTEAGKETKIDPLLLIAISSRESSLIPSVVGSLGERGLMQVHGVALSGRPDECNNHLESIACQVRTGARWLAWVRYKCPGATERWVSAYGRRRCPSLKTARNDRGVKIVKSRYMKIGGKQW